MFKFFDRKSAIIELTEELRKENEIDRKFMEEAKKKRESFLANDKKESTVSFPEVKKDADSKSHLLVLAK